MRIDDAVRGAVDGEWRTSREIWDRHGYGAETSTSKQLNVLFEIGFLERDTQPRPNGPFAYVYRTKGAR